MPLPVVIFICFAVLFILGYIVFNFKKSGEEQAQLSELKTQVQQLLASGELRKVQWTGKAYHYQNDMTSLSFNMTVYQHDKGYLLLRDQGEHVKIVLWIYFQSSDAAFFPSCYHRLKISKQDKNENQVVFMLQKEGIGVRKRGEECWGKLVIQEA